MKRLLATTAIAAVTALGGVSAALAATATTTADLNMRAGPGPQYEPVDVIPNGQSVRVDGCIQGSQWCKVDYDGKTGWAYGEYMQTDYQGQTVIVEKQPAAVPVVTYEAPANAPAAPPIHGELIGRVGETAPVTPIAPPPPTVQTYVTTHQVQPVYLNGEVVVGAGVPDTVQLVQVPDYKYDYTYVNGEPVLVDPGSRRIVYVYR